MTFEQYEQHKEHIHNLIVGEYFGKYWRGRPLSFEKSGATLIDQINELKPVFVLDVGCGYNLYKDKIECDLFVGIDPYNDNADMMISTTDYAMTTDDQYDVVMALGSINFGSKEKIYKEVAAIDKLTKKGGHIFVRANPGLKHNFARYPLVDLIEFYPWSKSDVDEIAKIYGYQLMEYAEETNQHGDIRLFFHYYK